MANSAGSRKRARQAIKRRAHNASLRSMVRTYVKKVEAQIEGNDYDAATQAFTAAQPVLDKMARKGILSPNKVSRTKARLNAHIKSLKAA
ncbi:30S ribosomal protein S20 [Gynuella sunshinyii]|uniref:Small ribosomal subunit protein bS20 n=1 Tax=Gynuella sunshinyii YC6258 TaxID=1445510 RepID=A0A0C5VVU2_9GAMM|nr:30S ribosomal protein S20 [Gynuella sunshinyii]AJQ97433.1 ribosomal protein S20 [Gynuella sunshinyii YC6258]